MLQQTWIIRETSLVTDHVWVLSIPTRARISGKKFYKQKLSRSHCTFAFLSSYVICEHLNHAFVCVSLFISLGLFLYLSTHNEWSQMCDFLAILFCFASIIVKNFSHFYFLCNIFAIHFPKHPLAKRKNTPDRSILYLYIFAIKIYEWRHFRLKWAEETIV